MCFLNIKACQHITPNTQNNDILKKSSYDPFKVLEGSSLCNRIFEGPYFILTLILILIIEKPPAAPFGSLLRLTSGSWSPG